MLALASSLIPLLPMLLLSKSIFYLSQYDCILINKIDNKLFGDLDVNKIVEYVRNGGGLSITLKGWFYRKY
jgi:hypothetical protein